MDDFFNSISFSSFGLLSPISDLIIGTGSPISFTWGRAGNDIFYPYDPIQDTDDEVNIDILFGDLFDNTGEEFELLLNFAEGNPFAILDADIPSVGKDRFVLGDEFQPYYTSSDPQSLLTTNVLGSNEFALIYDFDPTQDTIQLHGEQDDYLLLPVDSVAIPETDFEFSGYGVFYLQDGQPDLVSLIIEEPSVVELNLDEGFLFVGNQPNNTPDQKKIGQFGTAGIDLGYGVAVDSSGNLYVTGSTSGSLNGPNQGSTDVWVTKYDSNGNQIFAQQFGSENGETAYEITTDKYGNFYLAGSTSGSFVDDNNSSGGTDAWVAKYDKNGNKLWGRQVGENSEGGDFGFSTTGFGLQVDEAGNVYLSGLTINNNVKGVLDFPVEDDSWVIKLDENGEQQWFTKIADPNVTLDPAEPFTFVAANTPLFDESYDLAIDTEGNSYLVGWTQGLSRQSDPSRLLLNYDAWLSKVDTDGNVVWVEQFEITDDGLEFAWGVDTDSQGNIYVTGWFSDDVTSNDPNFEDSSSFDVFLTKFSSGGEKLWSKQVGSNNDDGQYFGDIVIDSNDNIFVSGYTNGKLTGDGSGEDTDGWVGRFDTNGNTKWIQQIGMEDKAEYATGLAVDDQGQLFVTGFTEGFLGTPQNSQAHGAAVDAWIAQLDVKDGSLQNFTGNTGSSLIRGTYGKDDLKGSKADETFYGFDGDDKIEGEDGDDTLYGGGGVDELKGGDDNDTFVIMTFNEAEFDKFDGGDEELDRNSQGDTIVNASGGDVVFNKFDSWNIETFDGGGYAILGNASKNDMDFEKTNLVNVSYVDTGAGEDNIKGSAADETFRGGDDKDKIEGKDGNDKLYGDAGTDELKGGDGNDILDGGSDNDKLIGEEGNDTLIGGTGNDELEGKKGKDTLIGVDPNAQALNGQGPGFGEYDKLKGGDQSDLFVLGDATQAYYLGLGNNDFALIDDFELDESDKIQLYSGASYRLETNVSGLENGTAIFANEDLIGIVKDVKDLSLTDTSVFTFA